MHWAVTYCASCGTRMEVGGGADSVGVMMDCDDCLRVGASTEAWLESPETHESDPEPVPLPAPVPRACHTRPRDPDPGLPWLTWVLGFLGPIAIILMGLAFLR